MSARSRTLIGLAALALPWLFGPRMADAAITVHAGTATTCETGPVAFQNCQFAANVAPGDLLFACGAGDGVGIATSASDDVNGAWVDVAGLATSTFNFQLRCWYRLNNSSSARPTFTFTTGSGSYAATVMVALSGVKTVSAVIGTPTKNPSGTGNVSTYTCPTVTPTAAGQALVGGIAEESVSNTDIVPNNSETEIIEDIYHLLQIEWKLTPNTTAVGPSWSINHPTADEVTCVAIIFDAAVVSTGAINPIGGPTQPFSVVR